MKRYDYIKKATHKLKNDKSRARIEAELFDHMDEKKQHLLDIGYDDEQSDSISERAMGDGFEISEQLYAQEKHRRGVWYEVILNIVTILLISFLAEINYSYISDFFKFELTFLAFALMLICIFLSSRRRESFNMYMVVCGGLVMSDQLAQRLVLALPSLNIYLARFTIAAYLIAYCIFSIVMRFKINRMKYSRRDITIERVVNAIHIGVIVIIAAVMFIVCFNTVNNYQRDIQAAKDELIQADELLLDNLDKLITTEDFKATIKSTFSDYDIAYVERNEEKLVTCAIGEVNNVFIDKSKENPFYLGLTKAPFDLAKNPILADVSELYINSDTKPSDLPLPAKIGYYSNDSGKYLYFNYDEYGKAYNIFDYFEDYGNFVIFAYDEQSKDFVLIDSDLANERVNAKLTPEQQDTLRRLCIDDNNSYPNAKLNIYNASEIIGTKQNNIYAIELGICYYAVSENGTIISRNIQDGYRILAQLDGENSKLITTTKIYYSTSPDYELSAKLITTTGLTNYRKADPYWYKDIDTSDAVVTKFKSRSDRAVVDMLNTIAETTSNSLSLDACISAFFGDYGSSDTFTIDSYGCSAYLSDDGREKLYLDLSMVLVLYYDYSETEEINLQIIYEPDDEIRQFMDKYGESGHEWCGIATSEKGEIASNIKHYEICDILKNKPIADIHIDWCNWEYAV